MTSKKETEIRKNITFAEVEELCIKAQEHKVSINISIEPDRTEISIEPWSRTVTESKYTQQPYVGIDTIHHP